MVLTCTPQGFTCRVFESVPAQGGQFLHGLFDGCEAVVSLAVPPSPHRCFSPTLFWYTDGSCGKMAMMNDSFELDGAQLLCGELCTDSSQRSCRAQTVRKLRPSYSCLSAPWVTWSLAHTVTAWSCVFVRAGGCARAATRMGICGGMAALKCRRRVSVYKVRAHVLAPDSTHDLAAHT